MPEMRTHEESLPVLLTPREVASTLRVDLSTVYRMIDRGTLGAVQFGGARHTVRIPAAELVRLSASPKPARSHGEPQASACCRRARSSRGAARQDDHQVSPPARVCRHGEIVPAGGSCARCQREKIERARRRGSTTARGYGGAHRALRKRLAPLVASGQMRCARCGGVIHPGEPWDLGHADGSRTRYHGAEHAACNRGASRVGGTPDAVKSNAARDPRAARRAL